MTTRTPVGYRQERDGSTLHHLGNPRSIYNSRYRFGAPRNPIREEFKQNDIAPTPEAQRHIRERVIAQWQQSLADAGESDAAGHVKNYRITKTLDQLDDFIDDEFKRDFMSFLHGRLPPGYKTPVWGKKPLALYHVKGVKEYIDANIDEREEFENDILRMSKFGPIGRNGEQSIFWAYLYFKYCLSENAIATSDFQRDFALWKEVIKDPSGGPNLVKPYNVQKEALSRNWGSDKRAANYLHPPTDSFIHSVRPARYTDPLDQEMFVKKEDRNTNTWKRVVRRGVPEFKM